jgi:uncharacterized protein with HEPN domain
MPDRRPSAIIKDILISIDHIQQYTSKLSFTDFSFNFMSVEACLYNIQIIGEAVTQLPEDVKKVNPHIPWSLIKGMRNRLIHEYFGTDIQLVWHVIRNELPSFKTEPEKIDSDLTRQNR